MSTDDLDVRVRSRSVTSGGRCAPYAPGVRTVRPASLSLSGDSRSIPDRLVPLTPPETDAVAAPSRFAPRPR